MKKFGLILFSAALLVACGGKGGNTAAEDSARIADSLARVDSLKQDSIAKVAQAKLDSLTAKFKADSIAAVKANKPIPKKAPATTVTTTTQQPAAPAQPKTLEEKAAAATQTAVEKAKNDFGKKSN